MTGTWIPKTNYFTIVELADLQEILDEILVNVVGYNPEKVWTLGAINGVCRNRKYLADNKVAINIQISNPAYTNEEAVLDFINKQDFDLAKYYFQKEEFLTQEEYKAYVPVMIPNPNYKDGSNLLEYIEKTDDNGNVLHALK